MANFYGKFLLYSPAVRWFPSVAAARVAAPFPPFTFSSPEPSQPFKMAACRRALALIEKSVRSHDVVVFSKTTCSFSILAKKILRDTGVQDMKVYELERREDGQQLQVEQGGTPICIVLEFYGYVLLDGVGFYSSRLTRGVSFTSFGLENGRGSRIYRH